MPNGLIDGFPRWTLCACIVFFPVHGLAGDRIELDTGAVFDGKIIRISRSGVSIRLNSHGTVSLRKNSIRKLRLHRLATLNKEQLAALEELPRGHAARQDLRQLLLEQKAVADKAPTRPPVNRTERRSRPTLELGPPEPVAAVERRPEPAPIPEPAPAPAPASHPVDEAPVVVKGDLPPTQSVTMQVEAGDTPPRVSEPPQPAPAPPPASPPEFEFTPPTGFLSHATPYGSTGTKVFQEPVSGAKLVLATYPIAEPILEVKNNAARAYSTHHSQVTRDEALAGLEYQAWILEVTSTLSGVTVRQMQVFVEQSSHAFVFTYSATARHYPQHRAAVVASLRNFRFQEPRK